MLAVSHGACVDTGGFLGTQAEGWLARQHCHGGQGSGTGSRLGCDRIGGMKWGADDTLLQLCSLKGIPGFGSSVANRSLVSWAVSAFQV